MIVTIPLGILPGRVVISWTLVLCVLASVGRAEGPVGFEHAVVAADHPAASEAGARILRQGGNVVDAAVATSFALSVVRPASCGIGGGGFMVIYKADTRTATALDYRERAPAGARPELFGPDADAGHPEPVSVRGGRAAGIPGTVAGLCHVAETYGTLPLSVLLQPAIDLCREGVPVDAHDMEVQASSLKKLNQHPDYRDRFAGLLKDYLNDGKPWRTGDRFHSPQLRVLERIASEGPAGFYDGPVADAIVAAAASDGGLLTSDDLRTYRPTERMALTGEFHGRQLITMPPPSSGGVALLQTLRTLEAWEKKQSIHLLSTDHNSPVYLHTVTEALKHAFADRAEYLGDSDFVQVPVDRLLSGDYAETTAAAIDPGAVLPQDAYGRFHSLPDGGTSHFTVLDASGNAVACTETINLTFGSFVVVPDYGILLNNQMDDFAAEPGKPNAFGLIQSEANSIQPGKKPLSSMTPTIVVQDGRAVAACGASGGPRIISATLQCLLNQTVFGMLPGEAVSSPRFHHQWSPDELLLESPLFESAGPALAVKGHHPLRASSVAAAQSAGIHNGRLYGGSDPRKHGFPAGF